jgi:transmembrane sensor
MSEIVKLRTRAEIDEEAALWIWRMESGNAVDTAQRQAFESWLREDQRHRRAVEELSKVWAGLDVLAEAKSDQQIVDLTAPTTPAGRQYWYPKAWVAAAAAVVLIVLGAAVWLGNRHDIQTVSTAVGQRKDVRLADGSIVTLNTNSIVDVDLSRHLRDVYLRKGEAHFEVAHDSSRPFMVHAGDAVVRAVGTAFEVRLHPDQHVDVLVNEGRVEVRAELPTPQGQAAGRGVDAAVVATVRAVGAGERFSTGSADKGVIPVAPAQLSSDLAWREGAIVFDTEPLSRAVVEIERYTDTRIRISDPQVAGLLIGGRFKTDDLQGFLHGLEAALPVTVRRGDDGSVYIDQRR